MHLFFYVADESGQSLTMNSQESYRHGTTLLASGARVDVGTWHLHLHSLVWSFFLLCFLHTLKFKQSACKNGAPVLIMILLPVHVLTYL
jgi:hypothetical protein